MSGTSGSARVVRGTGLRVEHLAFAACLRRLFALSASFGTGAACTRAGNTVARLLGRAPRHYARVVGVIGETTVTGVVRDDGAVHGDPELVARARLHREPSASPNGSDRDPLLATIRLARSCDTVASVEIFGADGSDGADGADDAEGADGAGLRSPLAEPVQLEMQHIGPNLPGAFSLEIVANGDLHVLHLRGELDVGGVGQLRDAFAALDGSGVVVDLSELAFLDASGLNALLEARRLFGTGGRNLELRGATGIVRRIFEVTSMSHYLAD